MNKRENDVAILVGGGYSALANIPKAISDSRNDFNPAGLKEYWLDQAKTFNEESLSFLRNIETRVKTIVEKISRGKTR